MTVVDRRITQTVAVALGLLWERNLDFREQVAIRWNVSCFEVSGIRMRKGKGSTIPLISSQLLGQPVRYQKGLIEASLRNKDVLNTVKLFGKICMFSLQSLF